MQGHTAAGSFDRRALHVARAEGGEGSLERTRGGIVERQRWQPRAAHGQARVVGEGLGAVDTARRGVEPGVDLVRVRVRDRVRVRVRVRVSPRI